MFTKDNFYLIATIIGLIASIPVYKGYFLNILSWNRRRKKQNLIRELDFFTSLQSSDRELIGWLFKNVLKILGLLSLALMLRVAEIGSLSYLTVIACHFIVGVSGYMVAISTLGKYSRLKKFEITTEKLKAEIKQLGN